MQPEEGAGRRSAREVDVSGVTSFRSVRVPDTEEAPPGMELATPEAVVAALYRILSGPAELERERDWDALRALVLPGARFLIARWPDDEGVHVEDLREWDVEGFIRDARRFYREDGFWEQELWGRTERFGNVAHRFSSYESRVGREDDDPIGRGVNSFQLVRFRDRWWIASIVWDVEGPDQPIPPAYTGAG
jgi:hypothetical protein